MYTTQSNAAVHNVFHVPYLSRCTSAAMLGLGWLSLAIIGGCCHKYNFCRDKSFVTTNKCLSQQITSFVAIFVATKVLSRQTKFCHDKQITSFVATELCLSQQDALCRDKHVFVAKVSSRQKWYLWHLSPMIFSGVALSCFTLSRSTFFVFFPGCIAHKIERIVQSNYTECHGSGNLWINGRRLLFLSSDR